MMHKPTTIPEGSLGEGAGAATRGLLLVHDAALAELPSSGRNRRFRKGAYIFRLGDPATDLHVIVEGQVKLVSPSSGGNERIIAIYGPDDFIGEAFLAESARYRMDAVALTEVVTCPVGREEFIAMSRTSPALALSFAERLTGHLFQSWDQLTSSYDTIKVRLAKAMLRYAERFGKPVGDGWVALTTELNHADLASMISSTRVSVSMAVAQLRQERLLEGTRGHYRLNAAALRREIKS